MKNKYSGNLNQSATSLGVMWQLEPRFMFDGAAVGTAAEVANTTLQEQNTPAIENVIASEVLPAEQSKDKLSNFTTEDTATSKTESSNGKENPLQLLADYSLPSAPVNEIVFIDTRVEGYESLLAEIDKNLQVVLLDNQHDAIEQIADYLAQHQSVDALHIISHGSAGQLFLGKSVLNIDTIQHEYADELAEIRNALTDNADILIYGCNVAEGDDGLAFTTALKQATGADIAASIDTTGAQSLGGDWVLESSLGTLESATLAVTGFEGVLGDAPTITDSLAGFLRITAEDTPLSITGITVADADNPAEISASFTVTGGVVTLANGSGGVISGDGTSSVTINGTVSQINTALDGMSFTPTQDQHSGISGYSPQIDISISDVINSDGPTILSINLEVTSLNDVPMVSGGTLLSIPEGGTNSFSAPVTIGEGFTQAELGLTEVDNSSIQTIIKITMLPTNGSLSLNGNLLAAGATLSVADISNLSYTHDGSQVTSTTTDTFNINIDDGAGGLLVAQAVTVSITPVNQAASLSGNITIIEGETDIRLDDNSVLTAPLSSPRGAISVSDPENAIINIFNITSLPSNGTLSFNGSLITAASIGSPFVVTDISLLTYSHDGSDTTTDSFDMTVVDDGGGTGTPLDTSATIDLIIHPNNDDPVLTTNVTQTIGAGTSLTITPSMLRVTDSDSADSTLTYTLTSVPDPTEGYFTLNGATLTVGATFVQQDIVDGSLVYVTRSDTARTDSISFTVKDGGQRIFPNIRDGGIYDTSAQASSLTVNTFNINVLDTVISSPDPVPGNVPTNTAPTITGSNSVALLESESVLLSSAELTATDSDNDPAELVYRLLSLPTSGSVLLNGVSLSFNQTFTQKDVNDGNVSFAHAGGEDFVDSFSYSVSDGLAVSGTQTFTITTTPQNDTPVATTNTQIVLAEGTSIVINGANITLSDADNSASDNETGFAVDNVLQFLITGDVTNGTLKLDGVDVVPNSTIVTSAQLANGDLIYTHNGSENFNDSFSLEPVDDRGIISSTATNQLSTGAELVVPITITPLNDAPLFFSKIELTGANAIEEGDTVIIGGATSYTTVNGVAGSGVPVASTGPRLLYSDADNSSVQRQYRVTTAAINGQLLLNSVTLAQGSVFTQEDLDNNLITYRHDGTETSTDFFEYVVSDGDWTSNENTVDNGTAFAQGTASTPSRYNIEINPRNDVPTLIVPSSIDAFASGAGTTAITGISFSDADLDDGIATEETDFVRAEIEVLDSSDASVATALLNYTASDPSGGNAFLSGKGTASLIVQGTKAQVDAILATLNIAFSADADASDHKIRVTIDDRLYDNSGSLTTGANGGSGSENEDGSPINADNNRDTKEILLRASNFNDTPTITNASSYSVNEDATLTLNGFTLSDVDSFGEDVTVTIELFNENTFTTPANANTEGMLVLGTTTGLTSSTGNNSNTITLTGSISEVQAALNSLQFEGALDYNGTGVGDGTLFFRTEITDFNHAGGSETATVDNTITISPVNDQPTLTVPNNDTLSSGSNISINGFLVGDTKDISQGATDLLEVTVAATNGGSPYGAISFVISGTATVTNNGTAEVVIKGSTSNVQDTLNSMLYTPADPNEDATVLITATVDDRDGGTGNGTEGTGVDGNNTSTDTFTINVSNNNEAPVLTAPATLTVNEDSSNNLISGISFADSDDFGGIEEVTLDLGSSAKGTITLTTITGLTFTTGNGTDDTTMVFTGTKAAINAALATLEFTPTADINTTPGNEQSLSITVNDLGNTGSNGALSDTEIISIAITPVNDAPTRTANSTTLLAVDEDSSDPAGNTVSNLFTGVFSDTTDTQTGGSTANDLAGIAIVGNAATATEGKWQYNSGSGWVDLPTAPTLNSAFLLETTDQVRFLPTGDWNGTPGQLTVRLIDDSSGVVTTGAGTDLSGVATGGITQYSNSANAVLLTTSIIAVNDAPVASNTATLATIDEDTTNPPGALVSSLINSSHYSDVIDDVPGGSSATALGGIAIVANSANPLTEGEWQYSEDGTTWIAIDTPSDTTAIILPTTASLRFVPIAEYSGSPGDLSIRVADSTQVFNGLSDISGVLGGTNTWSSGTVAIDTAVAPVNDVPSISGAGSTQSYTENNLGVILEPAISLTDIDDTDLNQAIISISNGFVAGDRLNFTNQLGISGSYDAATGELTLTGTVSRSDFETALQSITFDSTSDNPGNGTRTISWVVRDVNSESAANGEQSSVAATSFVDVTPVNDNPVAEADTGAVNENTTLSVNAANGAILSASVSAGIDTDVEDDTLTIIGVTTGTVANVIAVGTDNVASSLEGTYGHLTLNADGSYDYIADTAAAEALGTGVIVTDTFSYAISDGNGGSDLTTLTITVTGTNDAPTLVGLLPPVIEADSTTISIPIATGFTDLDSNNDFSYGATGLPTGLSIDSDTGEISGTLPSDSSQGGVASNGVYSITVTATDSNGAPVQQTFSFTATNPPPVANPDTGTVDENATLTVDAANGVILSNSVPAGTDTDVDGDTLTVTGITTGTTATTVAAVGTDNVASSLEGIYGHLTLNADGSYDYIADTAAAEALGSGVSVTDIFSYAISDGNGGSALTTLTITVTGTNDAPTLVGLLPPVIEVDSTAISIPTATGFTDLDSNNDFSFSATGLPAGLSIDPDTGEINGTLPSDASQGGNASDGVYSITVTATDSSGVPVQQTFSFTATNPPPVVNPDTGTVDENATLTVDAANGVILSSSVSAGTDIDVDGDTLTVTGVTTGTVATVAAVGTNNIGSNLVGTYGRLTLNADGSYNYIADTAAAEALGAGVSVTDIFSYAISDGNGGSDLTTLTITVTGTNDAPIANADIEAVDENATLTVDAANGVILSGSVPAGTDTDVDGDTLTVTGVTTGTAATTVEAVGTDNVASSLEGIYGHLTLNADGSYDYIADTAAAEALGTGVIVTDTFSYAINDGNGGSDLTTLTITVTGTNDVPTLVGLLPPFIEADSTTISISTATGFTDLDSNNDFSFNATGLPAGLSIDPDTGEINGTLPSDASQGGNASDGVYSITVTATDSSGAPVQQTFSFTATNPPPVANIDIGTVDENATLTVDAANGVILSNSVSAGIDTDVDGDTLTVTGVTTSTVATVAAVGTDNVASSLEGTYGHLTLNADGSYDYIANTAAAEALGAGVIVTDTFSYAISDGNGGTASTTLTITVTGTNDAPIANADIEAVGENATLTVGAANGVILSSSVSTGTDTDVDDDTLTVIGITTGTAANVTAVGIDNVASSLEGIYGHLTLNADGSYDYIADTAAAEALEDGVSVTDTFSYAISDGNGGTAFNTLTITVTGTNDVPTLVGQLPPVSETDSTTVSIPTATGFTDLDSNIDFSYGATGLPMGLSIDSDTGEISGTLPSDASQGGVASNGVYSITVTATDSSGASVQQTFSFTATNPPPIANIDTGTVDENATLTVDVANGVILSGNVPVGTDTDVDGDTLTITGVTTGTAATNVTAVGTDNVASNLEGIYGHLTLNADGSYNYIADTAAVEALEEGVSVTDTFTYAISDGNGGSALTRLIITITGTNDVPTLVGQIPPVSETNSTTLSIPTATGFTDLDSNIDFSFSATGLPAGLSIDPDTGEISGTLPSDASQGGVANNGVYSITVTATDSSGASVQQIFSFTADAPSQVNQLPPVIEADSTTVSIPSADGFTNLNGNNNLIYSATGLPAGLSIDPDTGEISGTLPSDASQGGSASDGIYSITVTATDSNGAPVQQTFSFTATNPPPVANIDTGTVDENATLTVDAANGVILSSNVPSGTDTDVDGDTLTVIGVTTGTAATTVTAVGTDNVASSLEGIYGHLTLNADGSYDYITDTAAVEALGDGMIVTDIFSYAISDGNGGSALTRLIITITGTNDVPTLVGQLPPVSETDSTTVSIPTATGFTDLDSNIDFNFSTTGLPAGLSIDSDTGEISGTLPSDASQGGVANNGVYSITVTATDSSGAPVQQTFSFTATNPAPVANIDTGTVDENATLTVNAANGVILSGNVPAGTDTDVDGDTLTITGVTTGTAATNVTAVGTDNVASSLEGIYGHLTFNADGSYDYIADTAAAIALGSGMIVTDTFSYAISDGNGGTALTRLIITVTGTNNSAPIANIDTGTVNENATLTVDAANGVILSTSVSAGTDTDVDGDTLTVTGVTTGTVANVGAVGTANVGSNLVGTYGRLTLNADGSYDYIADTAAAESLGDGVSATDTFSYAISDGQGGTDFTILTITVRGNNDAPVTVGSLPPVIQADSTAVSITTATGFSDLDNNNLFSYGATGLPPGLMIDPATGEISGTLPNNASQSGVGNNGIYTVTVTATESQGAVVEQIFILTATNPPLTANVDTATVEEGAELNVNAANGVIQSGSISSGADIDVDGDTIIVIGVIAGTADNIVAVGTDNVGNGLSGIYGHLTLNNDGSYSYIADSIAAEFLEEGTSGIDIFSYAVTDSNGSTAFTTLTITVTGVGFPIAPDNLFNADKPQGLVNLPDFHNEGIDITKQDVPFKNRLHILNAVNKIGSLNSIQPLNEQNSESGLHIIDVVQSIDDLQAEQSVAPKNDYPILNEVFQIAQKNEHSLRDIPGQRRSDLPDFRRSLTLTTDHTSDQSNADSSRLAAHSYIFGFTLNLQLEHIQGLLRHYDVSRFTVTGVDGKPLPKWFNLDAESGLLTGVPPVGVEFIEIHVKAELQDGDILESRLGIEAGTGRIIDLDEPEAEQAMSPLSLQLYQEGEQFNGKVSQLMNALSK